MILSANTGVIGKRFGLDKAIEILAKAGFDAVDVTLCEQMRDADHILNSDDYKTEAKRLWAVAISNGIYINQAHAYFPTSFAEPEKNKTAYERVVRGIEIAAILGAKIIVVHPNQHLYYVEGDNAEVLKQMNYEFYKSLLPLCEKYGIRIATENMWQMGHINKVIVDSTCSRGPEFCEYIDMIDSPWFTACLDIGHCGLVGQHPENMIRALGHDRLGALHVHDNNGREDNHVEPMAPFVSSINWEEVCKALAEIDYSGDFTFEAENMFRNACSDTVDAIARHLHDIGRYLIGRVEYYKGISDK